MNLKEDEILFLQMFKDYSITKTKEGTGWEIRKDKQLVRASELVGIVKKYQDVIIEKLNKK